MRRKSRAGKFVDDNLVFPCVRKLLMRNVIVSALMNRCKPHEKIKGRKKGEKRKGEYKSRVRELLNLISELN